LVVFAGEVSGWVGVATGAPESPWLAEVGGTLVVIEGAVSYSQKNRSQNTSFRMFQELLDIGNIMLQELLDITQEGLKFT
jgi:hypothetical protein